MGVDGQLFVAPPLPFLFAGCSVQEALIIPFTHANACFYSV